MTGYKNYPACCNPTNHEESSRSSDFSRLLRHVIEKGRGFILYSKINPGPHGDYLQEILLL